VEFYFNFFKNSKKIEITKKLNLARAEYSVFFLIGKKLLLLYVFHRGVYMILKNGIIYILEQIILSAYTLTDLSDTSTRKHVN
jgi:hypothetical protein